MTVTPNYKFNKKIVFHMWCPTYELSVEQKFIFNLHLNLLSFYQHIFDDVQINIACDDIHYPLLNKIKHKILDIFNRDDQNVCIKIVQNTNVREGKTCYEEIFAPGTEYNGIVFFGHSKGLTNVLTEPNNMKNIKHWVCALYYFSLNFMDECEHYLVNNSAFYGSILNAYKETTSWIYSGSFYWVNIHNLKNTIRMTSTNTMYKLSGCLSRTYAEQICGLLIPNIDNTVIRSHNMTYLLVPNTYDMYHNVLHNIEHGCCYNSPKDYENYLKFSDIIFNSVNNDERHANLF